MEGHAPEHAPRAPAIVAALAMLAVVGTTLLLAAAPIRTHDAWFHLKVGETYLHEGPWPAADPMLHTAHDAAPVQHEWLFGILLHAVSTAFGFAGLRAVHALAVIGIAALAFRELRRALRGPAATAAACAGVAAFVALAWWRLIQLRPDLVSIPAAIATYALLLSPDATAHGARAPGRRRIVAACLLALVWANLHSLFAIGLLLVVAGLAGLGLEALALLRARRAALREGAAGLAEALGLRLRGAAARARAWSLALAGMALAGALNPRGFAQHATFVSSSGETAIWSISDEWRHFEPFAWPAAGPVLSPLAWGLLDALLLAVLAIGTARAVAALRAPAREALARVERLDAVHLALAAAGCVAALVSIRFAWLGFFALLWVLRLLTRSAASDAAAEATGLAARQRAVSWGAALAALGIASAFLPLGGVAQRMRTLPGDVRSYLAQPYPPEVFHANGVRFLMDSGVEGRLYNRYTQGGFLGYWLAPRLRTFVDGRTEHYAPSVLEDYFRIAHRLEVRPAEGPLAALDRRGVDVYFGVGLPVEGEAFYTTPALEGAAGWIPVWRAPDHAIYLRTNPRNRDNLERVARYYAERAVPFDRTRGFDARRAARDNPRWAIDAGIVSSDYEALLRAHDSEAPEARAIADDRLATLYYLLGAYDAQIDLDRENAALRPRAWLPRKRLLYGLLRRGRVDEARSVLADAARIARSGAQLSRLRQLVAGFERALRTPDGPAAPQAIIDRVPLFTREELARFYAGGAPQPGALPGE